MTDEPIVAFPDVDPERLLAALCAAVTGDGPREIRLRTSASQCVVDEPSDLSAARWFQSLVELAYLVASADGYSEKMSHPVFDIDTSRRTISANNRFRSDGTASSRQWYHKLTLRSWVRAIALRRAATASEAAREFLSDE